MPWRSCIITCALPLSLSCGSDNWPQDYFSSHDWRWAVLWPSCPAHPLPSPTRVDPRPAAGASSGLFGRSMITFALIANDSAPENDECDATSMEANNVIAPHSGSRAPRPVPPAPAGWQNKPLLLATAAWAVWQQTAHQNTLSMSCVEPEINIIAKCYIAPRYGMVIVDILLVLNYVVGDKCFRRRHLTAFCSNVCVIILLHTCQYLTFEWLMFSVAWLCYICNAYVKVEVLWYCKYTRCMKTTLLVYELSSAISPLEFHWKQ